MALTGASGKSPKYGHNMRSARGLRTCRTWRFSIHYSTKAESLSRTGCRTTAVTGRWAAVRTLCRFERTFGGLG